MSAPLKTTPLTALHRSMKAKMAAYAGYDMPITYPLGVMKEHHHTRSAAGLFDVSHMGQIKFSGADAEKFLEFVTPADMAALSPAQARLSVILNDRAGVKDDCIITKFDDHFIHVVNAGCKDKDIAHMQEKLAEFKGDVKMEILGEHALIALQGPLAAAVLGEHISGLEKVPFMSSIYTNVLGEDVRVSRCGYTGEDGFEISVRAEAAEKLANALLKNPEVQMIGLAARDSLRLEAGMCLYTKELDEDTSPIAARLMWVITKRRMDEGGFVGHKALLDLKANAKELIPRLRGGVISQGPVARNGTEIILADGSKKVIGVVTSGCPSPTLGKNVAQCYLDRGVTKDSAVALLVRGKEVPGTVVSLPFTQPRYYKIPE